MKITKHKPWADDIVGESDSNGPKVETDVTFTETKIGTGFTAERLPYPTANRIHNRQDNAIKDIIESGPPVCIDPDEAVRLNMYSADNCFAAGSSALNRAEVGDTSSILNAFYPTKINNVRKVLVLDSAVALAQVIVVDAESMTVDDTVDLSSGLPAGTWTPTGICADGTNAYVTFAKSTYEQYVQAYRMSDWSVVSTWPATGYQFQDTTAGAAYTKIINANASLLAIGSPEFDTGAGAGLIFLIDKSDGSLVDSGVGDSGLSVGSGWGCYNLCSDGDYIYFLASTKLCSADITDLSTGCGGTNWPLDLSGGSFSDVTCAGGLVFVSAKGTNDIIGWLATTSNASIAILKLDSLSAATCTGLFGACFDGLNFWARGSFLIGATTRPVIAKCKIIGAVNLNASGPSPQEITDPSIDHFSFDYTDEDISSAGPNIIPDGCDIWFTCADGASSTNPYLFRFPRSHWR